MNISVPEDRAKQCRPASISTLPQGDLRDTQFIMSHGHLPAPTKAFVADVTPGKTAFWGGGLRSAAPFISGMEAVPLEVTFTGQT